MSSPVVVGRLADGDLPTLAGLYKQFWGEDSSLEKMREVFGRLSEAGPRRDRDAAIAARPRSMSPQRVDITSPGRGKYLIEVSID